MTAGSASGIAATASETAVSSISSGDSPRSRPTANTMAQIASTAYAMFLPKATRRFCSGVFPSSSPWSIAAIRPSSVCIPVATTTPVPRP